jgi:hypothetical protein
METAISKVYPVPERLSVLQPPDDENDNEHSFIWRDLTSITPMYVCYLIWKYTSIVSPSVTRTCTYIKIVVHDLSK